MKLRLAWVFLVSITLLFLLTGLLAAQSFSSYPTVLPAATYQEAPMLAERVAAGQLPAVEFRLPDDVQVVPIVDSIGRYGGTWRTVTWGSDAGNIKMKLYDPPVRWKADLTGYEPGLLVNMPVWSGDGQTITFTYRSGLKWSDGAPFTTADLQFWWEDLAKNPDYSAVDIPWWARNSDGTPITMEFPDEVTWVLHFDTAQYLMPYVLAQGFWEWESMMKPADYLKQWHPDYGGQAGAAGYAELAEKDNWFENPGYPCLMAWCLKDYQAGESWLFERNPYYWKVDPEGNQLPYIDSVYVELETDREARKARVAQGYYDCTFRGVSGATEIAFLETYAPPAGYELLSGWMNGAGAWPGFIVNQDYHRELEYDPTTEPEEDVEIRELLRNQYFRQGLSHALDRQRILDEVWGGIGEVKQFTISPQSPHFASPEGQTVFDLWATSYVTYVTSTTMSLWDSIGFVDVNSDGWRELPSGRPFTLTIDLNAWADERVNTQAVEIFRQNLEAVGLRVLVNNVIGDPEGTIRGDYGLYMLRTAHASELDLWTYPDWVFPVRGGGEGSRAFPMQGLWYQSGGTEGWQPAPDSPGERLQALYRQGLQEASLQARDELIWDAVNIHITEGPFVIGSTGDQREPVACKTYFRNVPLYGVLGPWAPAMPGSAHPEQFWLGLETPINPDTGGALVITDTQRTVTMIAIPTGSATAPITLTYTPIAYLTQPEPAWFDFANLAFDMNVYQEGALQPDFQFAVPLTVTINYSDSLVADLNETALTLTYWDEDTVMWHDVAKTCSPPSTYSRNPAENHLSVPICHLSRFALFATEYRIFLPLVERQQ
jgi:peptide/nickel transport system substrate-binding protein